MQEDPRTTRDTIDDVAALEGCIGAPPGAIHLKVIDHLDAGAARWLAASPLMFAVFQTDDGVAVSLAGGPAGFATVPDPSRMRVDMALLDDPALAQTGRGVGALFVIPGIGETLRVNGRVAGIADGAIEIAVEECYIHCAKALIRSAFWTPQSRADAPDAARFLAQSRFIALGTSDPAGQADLSPKGDPAGLLVRAEESAIWFADRPGNRRADSFRNILSNPRVALAALVPGDTRVVHVHGSARIVRDARMQEAFAVQGKVPRLVTRIDAPQVAMRESPALARACLWDGGARSDIDPAAVIAGHVRLSKARGLQASLVRTAVSVPGLMRRGLAQDYKTKLY